jgi:hypothetical protein
MSDTASDLIKIIELERSGIRQGDGYWYGSDLMGGITDDMVNIIESYRRCCARNTWERAPRTVGADDFPF